MIDAVVEDMCSRAQVTGDTQVHAYVIYGTFTDALAWPALVNDSQTVERESRVKRPDAFCSYVR